MSTQCLGLSTSFHGYPIPLSCLRKEVRCHRRVTPGSMDPTLSRHSRLCTVISNPWPWLCAVGVLVSQILLCARHSGNKTYVPTPTPIPLNLALLSLAPSSAPIPSISVIQPRFSLCIFILVHYPPLSLPILDQIFLLRLGQARNTGGNTGEH